MNTPKPSDVQGHLRDAQGDAPRFRSLYPKMTERELRDFLTKVDEDSVILINGRPILEVLVDDLRRTVNFISREVD